MQITLDAANLRQIFPRAPQAIIDCLVRDQNELAEAGILDSRTRLAYCLANVEHECGGFTIPNLTESIAYTRERAMQVWPSRKSQIAAIAAEHGPKGPAFQRALMNAVYGGRMGNRPGTDDGLRYIGRGGCQHTGRDGYLEMQTRTGLPLVERPELASSPEHQAALIAAFWSWKDMNRFADKHDFRGCVRAWNGGEIGMADRLAQVAGNDPFIRRFATADAIEREKPVTRPPLAPEPPRAPAAPSGAPPAKTPPAVKSGGPANALAAIGAVVTGGLAYATDNPWLLIAGVAIIAAGATAFHLLRKG